MLISSFPEPPLQGGNAEEVGKSSVAILQEDVHDGLNYID